MKTKIIYFLAVTLFSFSAFSQSNYSTNELGLEEIYSSDQIIKETITYITKNENGEDITKFIDIYKPNSTLNTKRPLVMLIHGGGFFEGSRTKLTESAKRFAKSGYIAATIDYRLTIHNCNIDLYRIAVYKATQDGHRALLKLISLKDEYNFNPNQIFLFGVSAGSATAMNMVYFEQDEANLLEPELIENYGTLRPNDDYYNSIKIKGVCTEAAGILYNIFDDIEAVPQILFHGRKDKTVKVYEGFSCNNDPIIGSEKIFENLSNKVCVKSYIEPEGKHSCYDDEKEQRDNMAKSFFKSLLLNTCQVDEPFICNTSSIINIVCIPEDNQNRIINNNPKTNSVNLQNENVLHFKFDGDNTYAIDFSMYDIIGKMIFERSIYVEKGMKYVDFELDKSISSGVYIIKWNDKNGNYYTEKIQKN